MVRRTEIRERVVAGIAHGLCLVEARRRGVSSVRVTTRCRAAANRLARAFEILHEEPVCRAVERHLERLPEASVEAFGVALALAFLGHGDPPHGVRVALPRAAYTGGRVCGIEHLFPRRD